MSTCSCSQNPLHPNTTQDFIVHRNMNGISGYTSNSCISICVHSLQPPMSINLFYFNFLLAFKEIVVIVCGCGHKRDKTGFTLINSNGETFLPVDHQVFFFSTLLLPTLNWFSFIFFIRPNHWRCSTNIEFSFIMSK